MSQTQGYNPWSQEQAADDNRPLLYCFIAALSAHGLFILILFAPFFANLRDWLFSRSQSISQTDTLKADIQNTDANAPTDPAKEKEWLEHRKNLMRSIMAPPKLPAAQTDDIKLGQDNGTTAPTIAWISYNAAQELIARQGQVIQPAQQSAMNPVAGAELIADPILGQGSPNPDSPAGESAPAAQMAQVPTPMQRVSPAVGQTPPTPLGQTTVPTAAPESTSVAASRDQAKSLEAKPAEPKPAEANQATPTPAQQQQASPAAEQPIQPKITPPPQIVTPAQPPRNLEQAEQASLGNKGQKPDAVEKTSTITDPKVAVKPGAESEKTQAAEAEKGIADQLAAGQVTQSESLTDRGPGIGPQETPAKQSGTSHVDGLTKTPGSGSVQGAPKPTSDTTASQGPGGSETREQSRVETKGIQEAKDKNQPTDKPTDQAQAAADQPTEKPADKPTEEQAAPAPTQVAMANPSPASTSQATAAPAPAQGQTQPTQAAPSPAPQPGAQAGGSGPQGKPDSTAKPKPTSAPKSDRDSAPVSLTDNPMPIQPGRVIAGQGIEIKTFHPQFSTVALISTVPSNPVCRIVFAKSGEVDSAEILRSSGYPNIDGPILASLYRWEATGRQLKELNRPFSITVEIILGSGN